MGQMMRVVKGQDRPSKDLDDDRVGRLEFQYLEGLLSEIDRWEEIEQIALGNQGEKAGSRDITSPHLYACGLP